MKVLVIPEDPTLDQHILKPIVERLFQDVGRKARVDILKDPHLRGVNEALNARVVAQVVDENPMVDLFLLMVDRDCNRFHNQQRAADREQEHANRLMACIAKEEVEVWMLALHRESIGAPWQAVQSDCDPKERYADPFLQAQGSLTTPGHGRKQAMRALAGQWNSLLQVCPELKELRDRLTAWLASRSG